jgi:hypothetical protein
MAYQGDQLQSVNPETPRDTDPEYQIAPEMRDLKSSLIDWANVEHSTSGKHLRNFASATPVGTNVYMCSLPHYITALDAGFVLDVLIATSNTGAATLEIKSRGGSYSLGAKAIKRSASDALNANDMIAGQIVRLLYDGTQFLLTNIPITSAITGAGIGVLIAAQETGFSYVTSLGTAKSLGALTIPINEYGFIKVTGEVRCKIVSLYGAFTWTIDLRLGATVLKSYTISVPNSSSRAEEIMLPVATTFAGGQTAATQLSVFAQATFNHANLGAALTGLRLESYAVAS